MSEFSFYDELLALLQPGRIFGNPRANGEGVRLAVIDSGIDRSSLESRFRQKNQEIHAIEGVIFDRPDQTPRPYEGFPSSPHGTTVADIILMQAPRVKLYSADIFGKHGAMEVDTVIAAIRYAMDVWNVKVINLSLGVAEQKLQQTQKRNQLLRTIEEAYYRDILIFAAAHNDHPMTQSYPAQFSSPLVSVDKGLFDEPWKFAYSLYERIEFQAHARGYFGPFANEPATSWATPHLAGIAARILTLQPNLKPFEMKAILYWMSTFNRNRTGEA